MTKYKEPKEYRAPGFSLTTLFNQFAAKAHNDFPQLKGKFIFYSVPTNTVHSSLKSTQEENHCVQTLKKCIEKNPNSELFACRDGADLYMMAWVRNMARTYTTKELPLEQNIFSALEHELGHLVAPCGYPYPYALHDTFFYESVADAFSFLRLHQTTDIKKPITTYAHHLALSMILYGRDPEHYTAPVIHEIQTLTEKYNLSHLTPVQCANIAYRTTHLYVPTSQQFQYLLEVYAPAMRALAAHDFEEALSQTILIMTDERNQDRGLVFRLGRGLLDPFLNIQEDILEQSLEPDLISQLGLHGKTWDKIRHHIAATTILFTKKTNQEILEQEARDMQALGYFDDQPDVEINPIKYESPGNQTRLALAREAYVSIRQFQITGIAAPGLPQEKMKGLTLEETALLAKKVTTPVPFTQKLRKFLHWEC